MLKFKYVNNREKVKRRYRQFEKVADMLVDHNRRCIKSGRFCDVYLICFK